MSDTAGPSMSAGESDAARRLGSADSESTRQAPATTPPGPRKRASRAGTRSVSNLSAAQLERKRANDREAQRAIRQRQKDHTDTLERKIQELTAAIEGRDREFAAAQSRIRDLEQENTYFRSRLGNDAFLIQLPHTDAKPADSIIAPSTHASPQVRFPGTDASRTSTESTRHSISGQSTASSGRPEVWRQASQSGTFSPSDSSAPTPARSDSARPGQWRGPTDLSNAALQGHAQAGQVQLEAHRSFTPSAAADRPQWAGASNYSYMVEPGQQQPGFTAPKPVMAFQQPPAHGQFALQSNIQPAPPQGPPGYGSNLNTPSTEFSNLSMQSPATHTPIHEQHPSHSPYDAQTGHIAAAGTYQGQAPQAPQGSLPRTPMAPPSSYNQPATTTVYPQPGMTQGQHLPLDYQGQPGQPGYPYNQYHGNG